MTFDAQMRIGSAEIVATLFAVAWVVSRPRANGEGEPIRTAPVTMRLRVVAFGGTWQFEGTTPLVVGRASEADVVVNDAEVSRRHARFQSERGIVYVQDLESRNGTFLNGRAVHGAIEVRRGDEIDVGTTRLVVEDLR